MIEIRVCYQICLNNSLSKVVQSMTSTFHTKLETKQRIPSSLPTIEKTENLRIKKTKNM